MQQIKINFRHLIGTRIVDDFNCLELNGLLYFLIE